MQEESVQSLKDKITTQPKIKQKKILIFIIAAIALILIFVVFTSPSRSIKTGSKFQTIQNLVVPSPTPFQFRELTIPYLRERSYKSSLGPLEKYSENQNYTEYLTSYDSDGFKINGLLTIPKDSSRPFDSAQGKSSGSKWPAIVFIHGYIPPTQYQTTSRYNDYVDYLARNGFVVFKIDLRGNGNSEGEPGGAYYSSDYVIDTLNAYAALQSSSFVNPDKIGLWGHSMAGNVVMRSFASKPTIPAVVIWAGAGYSYTDLLQYRINDQSYQPPPTNTNRVRQRQLLMNTYGQPSSTSAFWKMVAPTSYLNDLKGAIEINHAVNDDVVNIGYSRDLMTLLDKTSVPHELHEYSSGGHNISGASFTSAMENTVRFFKKYLE